MILPRTYPAKVIRWQSIGMAAIGVVASLSLAASPPTESLRENETGQVQIKSRTESVADQLDATIAEFDRNGLSAGDEVRTLRAIRSVLGRLTGAQMQQVIELLQKARSSDDPTGSTASATQAFLGQKSIIAQFRQLLTEYQRQQGLLELSRRLRALAERQATNLQSNVDLVQLSTIKNFDKNDINFRTSLSVQSTEQEHLGSEIAAVISDIRAVAETADSQARPRLLKALEVSEDRRIAARSAGAVSDLGNAQLFRAGTREQIIRDGLRDMAQLVAPPDSRLDRLQQASDQLQREIEKQKQLTDFSRDDQKRRAENMMVMEKEQGQLADQVETTRKLLADLSPGASDTLASAQDPMQQARRELLERKTKDATKSQEQAGDALELAKKLLDQQILRTQKDSEIPAEKLAATKELLNKTKDLMQKQQELNDRKDTKTQSTEQADLESRARELQDLSAEVAPEASRELGEGARDMQQARQQMAQKHNSPARKEQASAMQNLQQAAQSLENQSHNLQRAQDQLTKAEENQNDLRNLIQNQQRVQNSTNLAATKNEDAAPTDQIAKAQDIVKEQAKEMAEVAPDAQKPLAQAQQDMQQAGDAIRQNEPEKAQKPQQQAMANLRNAKKVVDQEVNKLQQELGRQANDQQVVDSIAQDLSEAQSQLGEGMKQLAEAAKAQESEKNKDAAQQKMQQAMKQASENLQKASEAAAKASSEDVSHMSDMIQQAVQQAQDSMTQAALEAMAKNAADAFKNSREAQEALAKAQTAMQMASEGAKQAMQDAANKAMSAAKSQSNQQSSQQPPKQTGETKDPQQANAGNPGGDPNGPRAEAEGAGKFVGLPPRDRAALKQVQGEKYSPEFAPAIEQYLRNLSDEAGK